MGGLVLKLGPRERVLINGAVIENGDKRGRLNIVTPNAKILRLKDALHPDEVKTPVSRVCYILQLMLSGDVADADARPQVLRGLEQLSQVFLDHDSQQKLNDATDCVIEGQTYAAMRILRSLMKREERLLEVATQ
ncbi:flagellar protein FlbT [Litoreibacter ponti]|uniref:Flagellar protein FlbT n=1 Tax=Litoreibacter ponti TaxID=1510457 RepID=A0A2T6BND4_9RHOB|nr:flagellar biosynthesis repressor FlbT [Litoreibacter ponti]PTX57581.1 flagellar protein FlbT [Litoreibacter ponti]